MRGARERWDKRTAAVRQARLLCSTGHDDRNLGYGLSKRDLGSVTGDRALILIPMR